MTLVGLGFLLFPAEIVGFFTDDAQVIALATRPLQMVGLIQPLSAAGMVFAGGLRGAGDTRYPMAITAIGIWLVRLPLAYVFALIFDWGLVGAWSATATDIAVRGVLTFLRFRGGRWKATRV